MQVNKYVPNTDVAKQLRASADLSEVVTWLRGISLPGRLTLLALGWRPQFLTTGTLPQSSLNDLTTRGLTFLQRDSRQSKEEGTSTRKSHAAISPPSYWFHSPAQRELQEVTLTGVVLEAGHHSHILGEKLSLVEV